MQSTSQSIERSLQTGFVFKAMALTAVLAATAMLAPKSAIAADVTATFTPHSQTSTQSIDHSAWSTLLQEYVVTDKTGLNGVNYAAFKSGGQAALTDYLKQLQSVRPADLTRDEQFAYWANLYNAKTIDIILHHYPVKSIKSISLEDGGLFGFIKKSVGAGGPWKTPVVTVAGVKLSLNDIEHNILRPIFKDPRVHYSVNCASIGCPNLGTQAFTGADINAQLDAAATAYVNHPRGINVSGANVTASSIYSWFKTDFGGNAQGVLAHVRKYAAPDLKAKLDGVTSISSYKYDWNLNDSTN